MTLPLTKNVFGYDTETKEFIGIQTAHLCPVTKGIYLYPAHTTIIEPAIEPQEGKAICFLNGDWSYVTDNRGKRIFHLETRQDMGVLHELGELNPEYVFELPPIEEVKEESE